LLLSVSEEACVCVLCLCSICIDAASRSFRLSKIFLRPPGSVLFVCIYTYAHAYGQLCPYPSVDFSTYTCDVCLLKALPEKAWLSLLSSTFWPPNSSLSRPQQSKLRLIAWTSNPPKKLVLSSVAFKSRKIGKLRLTAWTDPRKKLFLSSAAFQNRKTRKLRLTSLCS
jgi:hypothetical protein